MRTRQIVAVAALVPLVAGVAPADAAKRRPPPPRKPVCQQIKDAPNDATDNGTAAVPTQNDPSSDILSADVATNGTWLTVALRLASVEPNTTNAPTGRAYDVSFLAGGRVTTIRAKVSPAGNDFFNGKGQGSIDTATNTVYTHVKLADLGITLKPTDKLEQLKATTQRWVGTTNSGLGVVDSAVGVAPYALGWPTCLPKVGP